jgi:PAS domain S-box-containing protein
MADKESTRFYQSTLEAMIEGLQIISQDWRYLYVNEAVCRHGRKTKAELLGRTMMECYPGIETTEVFGHLRQCMRDRVSHRMENEFVYPDGRKTWFELHIEPHPDGALIRSMDISDRKLAEARFWQAQKLETIGRLAAGIAHDFNNKLSVISGYCEVLREMERTHDPIEPVLDNMMLAVKQSAGLTRQLLSFSREQVVELKAASLNQLLTESKDMLRKLLGSTVEMRFHLANDLRHVRVDGSQMDQVVFNLCVNARDAMPSGGTITIETSNVQVDESYTKTHAGMKPGEYVLLSVTDTGVGMTREVQARVFEPFFSTKPSGQGTGLGLATVQGVVRQCGGHLWLYSEVGIGTVFKIYLPALPSGKEEPASSKPATLPQGGNETLLLLEDDSLLRETLMMVLTRAGYRVLEAHDRDSAEKVFKAEGDRVALLLTDLVLRGSSGVNVSEELHKKAPALPTVFMSGYAQGNLTDRGILNQDQILLQKPISSRTLLHVVREVLDGRLTHGVF